MSTTTESKEVKDLKDIKEKIDLGLLEEDDEFEEFQAEGKLKFDLILIWKELLSKEGDQFSTKFILFFCFLIWSDWQEKDCDQDLSIWEGKISIVC